MHCLRAAGSYKETDKMHFDVNAEVLCKKGQQEACEKKAYLLKVLLMLITLSCFYFIQHKPILCNPTGGMNTTGVVMVVESPVYHSGCQNLSSQGPLN